MLFLILLTPWFLATYFLLLLLFDGSDHISDFVPSYVHRKKLFKETVSGLYNVKQQAFSSIAALREKMSGSTIPPPITPSDIHYVQDQNIHLNALVYEHT